MCGGALSKDECTTGFADMEECNVLVGRVCNKYCGGELLFCAFSHIV